MVNGLKSLSDRALREALVALRKKEHALTVEVVRHLGELEHRELFAKDGYSSLFSYCTQKLGYSESGANRRIRAARAIKTFPLAETLLASGEINLSTLSAVAGLLNAENSEALLRQIVGRTQREVDEIVAVFHAKPAPVRESVRAVAIKKSTPTKPESDLFSLPQTQLRNRQGCVEVEAPLPEPEKRFELRFSLSEKDMRDLEQAQLLLSKKYPRGITLEQTVQALVGEFLKRKSPTERNKRRTLRKVQKTQTLTRKRAISVPVRDAVFERDSGSCSYIGPDGHRCGCKHNLEVDHIRPWAKGGSSTSENLRLLCRRHNQLEAKRQFPER